MPKDIPTVEKMRHLREADMRVIEYYGDTHEPYRWAFKLGYENGAAAEYRRLSAPSSPPVPDSIDDMAQTIRRVTDRLIAEGPEACRKFLEDAGIISKSAPSIETEEDGISLIAKERREQMEKHGRSPESDVKINTTYQLADAASRMAWNPEAEGFDLLKEPIFTPDGWDIELWHKMLDKPYFERLIIAGALIAAEIDRLKNSK